MRSTMPSASSSRSRSDSMRSLMSGMASRSSAKRIRPLQQELDDRAGPSAADELDGLVKLDAELGFEAHACILPQSAHLTQATYYYIVTK